MNTKVPIPHRDEVTARQMGTLLQAAATLYPVLLNRDPDKETNNGSALEAAEATFMKICDRIDTLVDDADRWSLNQQRTLEMQLSQLYAQHSALLETQKASCELLAAPHTIHKPSLMKLEDGTWMAILGSLTALEHSVCAAGNTPAEALMAWDAVFTGVMQQQKFELQPDPAPTPAPRQRKKRNGK